MGEHEGVAVRRAALDFLHADDAVGAGLVVDDDGLAQQFREARRQDAGIDFVATGGAGNEQPEPPVGPVARLRPHRGRRQGG